MNMPETTSAHLPLVKLAGAEKNDRGTSYLVAVWIIFALAVVVVLTRLYRISGIPLGTTNEESAKEWILC